MLKKNSANNTEDSEALLWDEQNAGRRVSTAVQQETSILFKPSYPDERHSWGSTSGGKDTGPGRKEFPLGHRSARDHMPDLSSFEKQPLPQVIHHNDLCLK